MKKASSILALLFMVLMPGVGNGSASSSANPSAEPIHYTVLMMDRAVGVQTSTITAGGERRYFFQYNDRGRGPKLNSRIILGPDGIPSAIENTGWDYFKNRVAERFAADNGKAVWTNREEEGQRQQADKAFYVSMSGVPEEAAVLARALLAASGGKLRLLPEGEATIERIGELKVQSGGQTRSVVQYEIIGLDFTPSAIWLDQDQTFFAVRCGWLTVIRQGWESTVSALLKAQDAAAAAHARKMAKNLAHRPSHALVIHGARLFDSETATTRDGMTVVVSGNRIAAVSPDDTITVPGDAEFINAQGKTLIPGLWDMHAHLSDMDGPLNLAAGITTVRDLGNDIDKLLELRRKFDQGEAVGPRVIAAGLLDSHGPYSGPTKVLADTEAEARAAVDKFASLGYEQIKIYSSIKPELVPIIIDEAHKRGLRVSGHIPAFTTAEEDVKEGLDEINHINFLFLNFMPDVKDTRKPVRFTAVAQHGAELDLSSPAFQSFARLLRERNVAVDPTLTIFEAMLTDRSGTVSRGFAAVADRLPPQVRRGVLAGGLPVPPGMDERYHASFHAMLRMVAALHKAGVQIVAGTDSLAGFPFGRELELYVDAGIPAPEVLQLATLGAARVMKHDGELGSIAPGKLADLALVDGDPSRNIGDIRRVVTTIKDGVVYQCGPLYQAIGVRP